MMRVYPNTASRIEEAVAGASSRISNQEAEETSRTKNSAKDGRRPHAWSLKEEEEEEEEGG